MNAGGRENEFLSCPPLWLLTSVRVDVFQTSRTALYMCEHELLHTSVDLTSICTFVLCLFLCHWNKLCLFLMTCLTQVTLISFIISSLPCSCLTLVASVSVLKYNSYQDSSIRVDLKGVMGV